MKPEKVKVVEVEVKRKISFAENIKRLLTIVQEEERPFKLRQTASRESGKFLDLSQHKVRADLSQADGDTQLEQVDQESGESSKNSN